MEMFLMGVTLSILGFAVMAVAFGAATREEPREAAPVAKPARTLQPDAPRFFVNLAASVAAAAPQAVPIEVLLLQLERHVRLEQAAAESFLAAPTSASLHARTTSPLVH